jgi:hypothetical protein
MISTEAQNLRLIHNIKMEKKQPVSTWHIYSSLFKLGTTCNNIPYNIKNDIYKSTKICTFILALKASVEAHAEPVRIERAVGIAMLQMRPIHPKFGVKGLANNRVGGPKQQIRTANRGPRVAQEAAHCRYLLVDMQLV